MIMDKNRPEIRFDGFTEEWSNKVIGSVLAEVKRPIELKDHESYQLVTVKRRNEGVVPRAVLNGRDILVKNYFTIKAGDFLISKRQVVHGANGIVPDSLDNAVVSNEYLVITDSNEVTAKFLTTISKRPEIKKLYFISSYGVDIEKLVFDVSDWKERTIFMPTPIEQRKITHYFDKLEELSNQHKLKHDKLVNFKNAMLEKMFPKPGESVPEIRFEGFSRDWMESSFSESFSFLNSNTLSRAELNYEQGTAKNIHYGDILVKFGEVLDVKSKTVPYISSSEVVDKISSSKLQDGDILFADAAEDENVGKCVEVGNVCDELVFSGLHTIATRPNQVFSSGYLGYYLNSPSFHVQLLPLMQGTKVLSISKSAISTTNIKYPKDALEQERIGEYFKKLDVIINHYQQQITKLRNIQQACLDKMFV